MKVQIEGKLYIESDDRQFVIKEYNGKFDDKGKELFKTVGYYTSVKDCLTRFLTLKIKESTAATLTELREDIIRVERYIEKVMPV